jgi:hypothetical protein
VQKTNPTVDTLTCDELKEAVETDDRSKRQIVLFVGDISDPTYKDAFIDLSSHPKLEKIFRFYATNDTCFGDALRTTPSVLLFRDHILSAPIASEYILNEGNIESIA